MIGDVWFANLREERKEERDQSAREEKARQAASKSAPRLERVSSIPDPPVLSLRLRADPWLRSSPEPAQLRQPGELEGRFGVRSQFIPSPPPPLFSFSF